MNTAIYFAKELIGVDVVTLFVALLVLAMNAVAAPDAAPDTLEFGGIAALLIFFALLMAVWEPLVHEGRLPFRVPSAVGIPIGVVLFVVLFVSGLGELLLHVPELLSPLVALAVAGCILGGATYLSLRPDRAVRQTASSARQTGETHPSIPT